MLSGLLRYQSIALDPDRLRDTVLREVSVREEGTGGALKDGETYI